MESMDQHKQVARGVITINQARIAMDLHPLPDMDDVYLVARAPRSWSSYLRENAAIMFGLGLVVGMLVGGLLMLLLPQLSAARSFWR